MRKAKAVDRFCQGIYIGPGSSQSIVQCCKVSEDGISNQRILVEVMRIVLIWSKVAL